MAPNKSIWDHKADKDLLLAIIGTGALKGNNNWHNIAELMANMGHNFTHEAVRQHFQKLRREAGSVAGDDDAATPAKKTTAPKPRNKKINTPSKRSAKESFGDDDLNEDDEDLTPSKKVKKEIYQDDTIASFKTEGNSIDLEHDDIYEA